MTAGDTFPPGTPLQDGRFVISGVIASGGQATTYEGIDKRDGTRVAIKRFSVRGASSWKEVELAEREARVLGGLDHPALPKVISHFEEQGALYLVLEYIEGSTLEQLRTEHRLDQAAVVDYLKQVAEILHYIHGQSPPLVHRDIKPRNLIRRPDGRIALVDFGSVRDRLRPEGGSTVVGTFGYMAPEQFQGRATPASDTYGAAATALALLSGRDPDQLPHKGLRLDVEASLGTAATPEIKRFLDACLDPNPDTRPISLRGALATYPVEKVIPKTASYASRAESGDADAGRGQAPFSTHGYQRDRSRQNPDWHHGTSANHEYADLGQPPFSTHGYQRDRTPQNRHERRRERREARREERREERRARRERRVQRDLDLQRPFAEFMAIPEVRRVLRIPVVGLVALVLLVVLRTALWTVLGVVLPRLLQVIQRFTGARLDDAVEQTTLVGSTLKDQLSQVAGQLREEPLPDTDDAQRYRVATPERSRFDTMADNVEKRAAEFEAEISAATSDWERRSRK